MMLRDYYFCKRLQGDPEIARLTVSNSDARRTFQGLAQMRKKAAGIALRRS